MHCVIFSLCWQRRPLHDVCAKSGCSAQLLPFHMIHSVDDHARVDQCTLSGAVLCDILPGIMLQLYDSWKSQQQRRHLASLYCACLVHHGSTCLLSNNFFSKCLSSIHIWHAALKHTAWIYSFSGVPGTFFLFFNGQKPSEIAHIKFFK